MADVVKRYYWNAEAREYTDRDGDECTCAAVVWDGDYMAMRHALKESLKLQSHYAYLLNAYDGGERIGFATVDKWMARLAETGSPPSDEGKP